MTYFSSKIIKIFFCGYDRYYWLNPFNVAIVYRHVCILVFLQVFAYSMLLRCMFKV